jgi:hypothetical protein
MLLFYYTKDTLDIRDMYGLSALVVAERFGNKTAVKKIIDYHKSLSNSPYIIEPYNFNNEPDTKTKTKTKAKKKAKTKTKKNIKKNTVDNIHRNIVIGLNYKPSDDVIVYNGNNESLIRNLKAANATFWKDSNQNQNEIVELTNNNQPKQAKYFNFINDNNLVFYPVKRNNIIKQYNNIKNKYNNRNTKHIKISNLKTKKSKKDQNVFIHKLLTSNKFDLHKLKQN